MSIVDSPLQDRALELAAPGLPQARLLRFTVDSPHFATVLSLRRELNPAGTLDAFDLAAEHYLLEFQGEPTLALRVNSAKRGPLECEEHYPGVLVGRYRDSVASASRLLRNAKTVADSRLTRGFVSGVWLDQLASGIRVDLINTTLEMAPFYARMGYRAIPASEFEHPRLRTRSIAMVLLADGRVGSKFRDLVQSGGVHQDVPAVELGLESAIAEILTERPTATPEPRPMARSFVPTRPAAGSKISLSSGPGVGVPRHRVIDDRGGDRLAAALAVAPALRSIVGSAPPLLLNAYPAPLGEFASAVTVDTYGRPLLFARALELAREWDVGCCIIGQPFLVAQLLASRAGDRRLLPRRIALGLGGYECPASLERWLRATIRPQVEAFTIVHAYGSAEIDFACLLGVRDQETGEIAYQAVVNDVSADIDADGRLSLRRKETIAETGDLARSVDGHYFIQPGDVRTPLVVRRELDRWTGADWARRTGYIAQPAPPNRMMLQLRPGEPPRVTGEYEFYEFARLTGMSWQEKPRA